MSDNTFPVTEQTIASVNAFAAAVTQNHVAAPSGGGMGGFLKFNGKTGRWEMGKEEEDFEGVEVLVNSLQIKHGYIRWGTKPPAKAVTLITQPMPAPPAPFDGKDQKGQPKTFMGEQSRVLVGATNDDEKEMFQFETNSMGGVERVDQLIEAIKAKAANSMHFFPRVVLANDHYSRDTGKVYKPVFTILGWCDVEGNEEGAAPKQVEAQAAPVEAAPVEAAAEAAPAKKRRKRGSV